MGHTRGNAELILPSSMFTHVSCPLIVTPTPRLLLLLGQRSAPKYRDAVRAQTWGYFQFMTETRHMPKYWHVLPPLFLGPYTCHQSPQVVHARCRFVLRLQKYACNTNIRGKVAVPLICYSDSSILDDRLHATQRTMAWTTEATMSENSSSEFRAQECVDDRVYRRAGYLQNYTPKINYEKIFRR